MKIPDEVIDIYFEWQVKIRPIQQTANLSKKCQPNLNID